MATTLKFLVFVSWSHDCNIKCYKLVSYDLSHIVIIVTIRLSTSSKGKFSQPNKISSLFAVTEIDSDTRVSGILCS